jgi:hypothetical protein
LSIGGFMAKVSLELSGPAGARDFLAGLLEL